jgi:hypothetical protein
MDRRRDAAARRKGSNCLSVSDPVPRFSFRKKRGPILSRMPRSAPGFAGSISGDTPRPDRISWRAEFQSRSVFRIFRSARASLLKPPRSFSPYCRCKKSRRDNSVNVEQLIVRNPCRIVSDFDRFAIARLFRGDEFVGRIRFCSARITNDGFDDAFCFIECRLDAPKATASENRSLGW